MGYNRKSYKFIITAGLLLVLIGVGILSWQTRDTWTLFMESTSGDASVGKEYLSKKDCLDALPEASDRFISEDEADGKRYTAKCGSSCNFSSGTTTGLWKCKETVD